MIAIFIILCATEYYRMSKSTTNTTFKRPLLNNYPPHLAIQRRQYGVENEAPQRIISASYESLLTDIVTYEFIRGYN